MNMQHSGIPDRTIPTLLCVDGSLLILLAIFAHRVGLDLNADWGPSRYAMMGVGGVLLLVSFYAASRTADKFTTMERVKTLFLFSHVWVFVLLVYAWFITYGTFISWEKSTRYYAHLADAFIKGQLHVDIEPDAELAAAPDPYSSVSRPRFDDEIWDMSLYKGKLYIYWGPVPALLMAPFQARSDKLLLDLYPVYFFLSGLFIVNSLILLKLRQWFYSDVPLWNFLASIFLIGFILPILWSLNIPEVYQAAIGAGQFFLMGGVLFSFLSTHDNRKWYLFLAGLFWACSVGSRAINVFRWCFCSLSWSFGSSKDTQTVCPTGEDPYCPLPV